MKKWLIVPVLCFLTLVCLKPERDNRYDPYNPDKAYLEGNVYGFDAHPVKDAKVALTYDDIDFVEQHSDNEGWYQFERVDPGIYKIVAIAEYYEPFEYYPESLPAGRGDTFDVYFCEAFWDFENEALDTEEPNGFSATRGDWLISQDPEQGRVYTGHHVHGSGPFAIAGFNEGVRDFYFETEVKVLESSTSSWEAGIVLRYQDELNFYYLRYGPGYIKLYKRVDGSDVWLADDHSVVFLTNTWYNLSADFSGTHIQICVDNNLFFELDDPTFSAGNVGFFVRTLDMPGIASASFDNVYIDISE